LYEAFEGLDQVLVKNQRLMVITPDECVPAMEALLGRRDMVIGIREAKGLEVNKSDISFSSIYWYYFFFTAVPEVILLDFFSNIPGRDQKAWKQLLSDEFRGGLGTIGVPQSFSLSCCTARSLATATA